MGFVFCWTPYAIVCLYRAFLNEVNISPLAATLPAFFAKSSLAWPALFSLMGNKVISQKKCGYDLIMRERNRSPIVRVNFIISTKDILMSILHTEVYGFNNCVISCYHF